MKNPASLLVCLDTWDGGVGFENDGWYMAEIEVIGPLVPLVDVQRIFSVLPRKGMKVYAPKDSARPKSRNSSHAEIGRAMATTSLLEDPQLRQSLYNQCDITLSSPVYSPRNTAQLLAHQTHSPGISSIVDANVDLSGSPPLRSLRLDREKRLGAMRYSFQTSSTSSGSGGRVVRVIAGL